MVNPIILLLTPAQPNRATSIQTSNYEQLFIVAISEKYTLNLNCSTSDR